MHISSFSHPFHRYASPRNDVRGELITPEASKSRSIFNASGAVRMPESSKAINSSTVRSKLYPEYFNAFRNPADEHLKRFTFFIFSVPYARKGPYFFVKRSIFHSSPPVAISHNKLPEGLECVARKKQSLRPAMTLEWRARDIVGSA